MNIQVMEEATERSLKGTITFGEVVRDLIGIGVEAYNADLVRMEKTYYMPNGDTHIEKLNYKGPVIGQDFMEQEVVAAIKAIQKQEINYVEFLDHIMKAGATRYTVFLTGKKAIYFGRKGEFHIENFTK